MKTTPYLRRDNRRLLNLDTSCTYFLVSLANQLSAQASHEYRKRFAIGVTEWRCLVFIALETTSHAARISELSKIDKALVSRALKKLENLGFIVRSSRENARPRPLRLTAAGERVHDEILEFALANERDLRAGLSQRDIAEFLRIAKKMQSNIDSNATQTRRQRIATAK